MLKQTHNIPFFYILATKKSDPNKGRFSEWDEMRRSSLFHIIAENRQHFLETYDGVG